MGLKLWLLTQDECNNYESYHSMVVVAETELEARMITPLGYQCDHEPREKWYFWPCHKYVEAKIIGDAIDSFQQPEVILASFDVD